MTVNDSDALTWDSEIGPKVPEIVIPQQETSAVSERALIGAILADAEEVWKALDAHTVSPGDFHDHGHQEIMRAVYGLRTRNHPVDLLTVTEALKLSGKLEQIGGPFELNRFVDDCPLTAHAGYYAKLVSEHAQRRRLSSMVNRWTDAASKGMPGPDLLEKIRQDIERDAGKRSQGSQEPDIRPIGAFKLPPRHDTQELLKHRFLCRGGALLLVGPTGIGKSSFVMQGAIRWALGLDFFGIQAAAPMKVLIVQAENDDGDIAEMRDGVYRGLKASGQMKDEHPADLADRIAVVCEDSRTGRDFGASLDRLLGAWKPDLVIIDPALAYLGGDALKQADVTLFCRNILNPLIHRHQCGLILVHHTNKPPRGEEKSDWKAGDLAYLGQGAADWANWARAVVAIRAKGSHSVYELCLGKRGRRAGWSSQDGKPIFVKNIAHACEPGMICWRTPDDAESLDAATPDRMGRPKKDWNAARTAAVAIAGECVRTRSQLKSECLRRIPDIGSEDQYEKQVGSAITAAVDDGKLEEVRTHDGTRLVFLVGPTDGSVARRTDEIHKARESKKQRELET